jgi:hypothetical protein
VDNREDHRREVRLISEDALCRGSKAGLLRLEDTDSERMVIHIRIGEDGKNRDVLGPQFPFGHPQRPDRRQNTLQNQ